MLRVTCNLNNRKMLTEAFVLVALWGDRQDGV